MCVVGPDRVEEIGELGWSAQERPSFDPKAERRSRRATGEAVAEEMADVAEGDSAFPPEVVEAGGAPFAVVGIAVEVFMETVEVVEVILWETWSRAGGRQKIERGARITGGIFGASIII